MLDKRKINTSELQGLKKDGPRDTLFENISEVNIASDEAFKFLVALYH